MNRNDRPSNGAGRLRFLILHGPNTNLFGRRETNIYGLETLEFIDENIRRVAAELGVELIIQQSNHEGVLVDAFQSHIDDVDGAIINPAGFTIHSAVHAAREDALCVMHLHTDYGIAVSAQKDGLLPLSQQAMFALSSLAYHDYEGLALDEEEKPRLVNDLADKKFMILRNHGLLTVGRNAAEAFLGMFLLERACKIQILAQSGGGELSPIPNRILAKVAAQMDAVTVGQGAALTWPGLLRKLDRIDPTYRD